MKDSTLVASNRHSDDLTSKTRNLVNSNTGSASEPILLTSLIDDLVSEKRIQFRTKVGITIDTDIDKAYGVFVQVPPIELKRALSNMINNSIEAFPNGKGQVMVSVKKITSQVQIIISDNGKGIPSAIISKLGEKGFSYGKEKSDSGSGLGVFHVKNLMQKYGGQFEVHSVEATAVPALGSKQGTTITLTLPTQPSPAWFVEKLEFSSGQNVFVIDDDQSIHGIWKGRLSSAKLLQKKVHLYNYTSAYDFIQDYQSGNLPTSNDKNIFLMDYEFLEQNINGLEVIQKLGIQKQSILITSRYEEKRILESCNNLGVPLIPKGMVGFVPFVQLEIS